MTFFFLSALLLETTFKPGAQNESARLSPAQAIVAFPADFSFSEEKQTSLLADTFSAATKKRLAELATHTLAPGTGLAAGDNSHPRQD